MNRLPLALLALAPAAALAVEPLFTHQGRLLDATGAAVSGPTPLTLSLFPVSAGGIAAWSSTSTVPVTDGYFTVQLGPDPALSTALRDHAELWLEVAVGNPAVALSPRHPLGAVPRAATALGAGGLRWGASRLDYGVGIVGEGRVATLENASSAAATDLEIDATNGFVVRSTTCGATLAAGATCTAEVAFSGAGLGAQTGLLVAASTSTAAATSILSGEFATSRLGAGIDGNLVVSGSFDPTTQVGGSARSGYADAIAYQVASLSGTSIVTATPADGIGPGDKVLLVMLQSSDPADVGKYDVLDVSGRAGTTLTIVGGVDVARYDAGTNQKIVVQRIPQYASVTVAPGGTIAPAPWDGLATAPLGIAGVRTGIVALFAAGQIDNQGAITASARGFRGGPDNDFSFNSSGGGHGYYGEGWSGGYNTRATWNVAPSHGGGGGGWTSTAGCCHGNGGGGGGYATAGGTGSIDGSNRTGAPSNGALTPGGTTYGQADLSILLHGGGGGSGGSYSGTSGGCGPSDPECNTGGTGGGIVLLRADTLVSSGTVSANGGAGFPQPGTAGCDTKETTNTQDGSGGSGAGGSILLQAASALTVTGAVSAQGGPQGCRTGYNTNYNDRERGGAGGLGRVRFEAPAITGTSTPAASTGGF